MMPFWICKVNLLMRFSLTGPCECEAISEWTVFMKLTRSLALLLCFGTLSESYSWGKFHFYWHYNIWLCWKLVCTLALFCSSSDTLSVVAADAGCSLPGAVPSWKPVSHTALLLGYLSVLPGHFPSAISFQEPLLIPGAIAVKILCIVLRLGDKGLEW